MSSRDERAYENENELGGGGAVGRHDCGVARGWFPRVAFNHPEAMNILFDGQFRSDSDRMEHRSWLAHPFGPFSCVRMRHACDRAIAAKIKKKGGRKREKGDAHTPCARERERARGR